MPNLGRCAECPFYVTDRNRSIKCEDVVRLHKSLEQKKRWMCLFCYTDWVNCPFALRLERVYDEIDGLDYKDGKIAYLEHIVVAQAEEIDKLRAMINSLESKNNPRSTQEDEHQQLTLLDCMGDEDERKTDLCD